MYKLGIFYKLFIGHTNKNQISLVHLQFIKITLWRIPIGREVDEEGVCWEIS